MAGRAPQEHKDPPKGGPNAAHVPTGGHGNAASASTVSSSSEQTKGKSGSKESEQGSNTGSGRSSAPASNGKRTGGRDTKSNRNNRTAGSGDRQQCRDFASPRGCSRGDKCRYSHGSGSESWRRAPNNGRSQPQSGNNHGGQKWGGNVHPGQFPYSPQMAFQPPQWPPHGFPHYGFNPYGYNPGGPPTGGQAGQRTNAQSSSVRITPIPNGAVGPTQQTDQEEAEAKESNKQSIPQGDTSTPGRSNWRLIKATKKLEFACSTTLEVRHCETLGLRSKLKTEHVNQHGLAALTRKATILHALRLAAQRGLTDLMCYHDFGQVAKLAWRANCSAKDAYFTYKSLDDQLHHADLHREGRAGDKPPAAVDTTVGFFNDTYEEMDATTIAGKMYDNQKEIEIIIRDRPIPARVAYVICIPFLGVGGVNGRQAWSRTDGLIDTYADDNTHYQHSPLDWFYNDPIQTVTVNDIDMSISAIHKSNTDGKDIWELILLNGEPVRGRPAVHNKRLQLFANISVAHPTPQNLIWNDKEYIVHSKTFYHLKPNVEGVLFSANAFQSINSQVAERARSDAKFTEFERVFPDKASVYLADTTAALMYATKSGIVKNITSGFAVAGDDINQLREIYRDRDFSFMQRMYLMIQPYLKLLAGYIGIKALTWLLIRCLKWRYSPARTVSLINMLLPHRTAKLAAAALTVVMGLIYTVAMYKLLKRGTLTSVPIGLFFFFMSLNNIHGVAGILKHGTNDGRPFVGKKKWTSILDNKEFSYNEHAEAKMPPLLHSGGDMVIDCPAPCGKATFSEFTAPLTPEPSFFSKLWDKSRNCALMYHEPIVEENLKKTSFVKKVAIAAGVAVTAAAVVYAVGKWRAQKYTVWDKFKTYRDSGEYEAAEMLQGHGPIRDKDTILSTPTHPTLGKNLEERDDGVILTCRMGNLVLSGIPETDPQPAIYPVLVTNGLKHGPTPGTHTCWRAVECRNAVAVPDTKDEVGWNTVSDQLAEQLAAKSTPLVKGDAMEWALHYADSIKRKHFVKYVEEQEEMTCPENEIWSGNDVASKGFLDDLDRGGLGMFAKTNETLTLKRKGGLLGLKPRTIITVPDKAQYATQPWIRPVSKKIDETFEAETFTFEYNGKKVHAQLALACGKVDTDLTDWLICARSFVTTENHIALIVMGDDSLVVCMEDGILVYYENDFSHFDNSQKTIQIESELKVYRKMGIPVDVLEVLRRISGAKAKCKKRSSKERYRVTIKCGTLKRISGAPTTSIGNSIVNIIALIMWFCLGRDDEAWKIVGFTAKMSRHTSIETATFLHGTWMSCPDGVDRWMIFPSQVLNLGKTMKRFRQSSLSKIAYGMGCGAGAVNDSYPILGPFLRCLRRNGRDSGTYTQPLYKIPITSETQPSRDWLLRFVWDRYHISEDEVIAVEAVFDSIDRLPYIVCHPLFMRLQEVDY